MRRRTFLLAGTLLALAGCHHVAHEDRIKEISVEELAGRLSAHGAIPIDANTVDFRRQHGVIPEAVQLSSSGSYAANELPADKSSPLVFYCSNRL
jgi:hypothetical protein